jgi:NADPH:quinone reductase-like Zn-dependent oxidoreductase
MNPGSFKVMNFPSLAVKKPAIPETDISGTIISVGKDIKEWSPGDKVYGIIPANDMMRRGQGGLTEYTLLHSENMFYSLLGSG